jgi:hypothetical protein
MAQRARNPEHKKILTNLAQTWLSLAIELERSDALMDAYPEPDSRVTARRERHH